MLKKDKDYITLSSYEILKDIEDQEEVKLELQGKKAGDLIAYIYNDNTTEGFDNVFWKDFNSKKVLKDILDYAETKEFDCAVWINDIRVR